ncbi:MAG: transketolase family protein [Actinobacteria bacterium]|nr:transketolase family protein [Actinomycetota bacterium]
MKNKFQSIRESYGKALVILGSINEDVVVIDSDVAHATKADYFKDKYPDRFIQMGVAEQNTVSTAAGLAEVGLIPYINNFAAFVSRRAHDQIFVSISYSNFNVKICGCYCGITTSNTGATHQSIDDMAVFRSLPNFTIIDPADSIEVASVIIEISKIDGPVYIRIARNDNQYVIFEKDYKFKLGKGIILSDGHDITLIGTGIMSEKCLKAKELLKKMGIKAKVIHMPTIKPLDNDLIINSARETGYVLTIENHSIIGGLGSSVAELIAEKGKAAKLLRMGIINSFGCSGSLEDLYRKFKLTELDIVNNVNKLLKIKLKS